MSISDDALTKEQKEELALKKLNKLVREGVLRYRSQHIVFNQDNINNHTVINIVDSSGSNEHTIKYVTERYIDVISKDSVSRSLSVDDVLNATDFNIVSQAKHKTTEHIHMTETSLFGSEVDSNNKIDECPTDTSNQYINGARTMLEELFNSNIVVENINKWKQFITANGGDINGLLINSDKLLNSLPLDDVEISTLKKWCEEEILFSTEPSKHYIVYDVNEYFKHAMYCTLALKLVDNSADIGKAFKQLVIDEINKNMSTQSSTRCICDFYLKNKIIWNYNKGQEYYILYIPFDLEEIIGTSSMSEEGIKALAELSSLMNKQLVSEYRHKRIFKK